MNDIRIRRIYAEAEPDDGYRVLVDRLWPRGIRKETANMDDWVKDVAPSTALRKDFDHQAEGFWRFQRGYWSELDGNPEAAGFARRCKSQLAARNVTLLYAANDETYNNASVLREWVLEQLERGNRNEQ